LPKDVIKLEKRSYFHPKKFNTMLVIAVIDKPEIVHPFLIPSCHWTIRDPSLVGRHAPKSNKQPGTDD
jgi:hypothetical protein